METCSFVIFTHTHTPKGFNWSSPTQGIMLFLKAIGCQIKLLVPDVRYIPPPQLIVGQRCPIPAPKQYRMSSLLLVTHQNIDSKSLLLKTPHTLAVGHYENQLYSAGCSPLQAAFLFGCHLPRSVYFESPNPGSGWRNSEGRTDTQTHRQ